MEKILLLHGALGSKEQFNELNALLKEKYEVHALDFYGHGGVDFKGEFSVASFSEQVMDYLQAHALSSVTVFGYSMGGYVGLYTALHYPEKVKKVVTLATKFYWSAETAQNEIKMLDAAYLENKAPAFVAELKRKHGEARWKKLLAETAKFMISLGDGQGLNIRDLTGLIHPVLIGLGDRDKMVSLEESLEVYKSLKNGAFYVLPYTKHPFESVDTKQLAFTISSFIS